MDKCSFCIAGICILWWGLSFVQAALLVLQQLLFAAVCDEWSSEAVHLFSIHIYIVQFAGLSLCSRQPHDCDHGNKSLWGCNKWTIMYHDYKGLPRSIVHACMCTCSYFVRTIYYLCLAVH